MKTRAEKCFQDFSKKVFKKWAMVKFCGKFRGKILGKIQKAEFPRISNQTIITESESSSSICLDDLFR